MGEFGAFDDHEKTFAAAVDNVPVLTEAQVSMMQKIMTVAAHCTKEIRSRVSLELMMERWRATHRPGKRVEAAIAEELRGAVRANRRRKGAVVGGKTRLPILIDVVLQMIRQRPELSYTIAEIASAARVTPNHLSALFRRATGMTFSKFLTETRIERAKELLGDLTLTVAEVAQRAGFDDPGYFARRFRAHTGVSPREWREQLVR